MAEEYILVVDDEEVLCDVLSYNLRQAGYRVEVAHSAEEVLARSLAGVQLLLLDVMMGRMSGLELVERLKRDPETAHLPIILLTARDSEDDRVGGLMLGADDYIAKPFGMMELMARIRAALRQAEPQGRGQIHQAGIGADGSCRIDHPQGILHQVEGVGHGHIVRLGDLLLQKRAGDALHEYLVADHRIHGLGGVGEKLV